MSVFFYYQSYFTHDKKPLKSMKMSRINQEMKLHL